MIRGVNEMTINEKYYNGFEGESEIIFSLIENDITIEKIGIWDGYFNAIMELVEPEENGWTGLAYYYHLYTGWYEEENWLIPNVLEAYKQLSNIDASELVYREEKEVLFLIVDVLKHAVENNGKVFIVYD